MRKGLGDKGLPWGGRMEKKEQDHLGVTGCGLGGGRSCMGALGSCRLGGGGGTRPRLGAGVCLGA